MFPHSYDPNLVRPFVSAENQCLQVLLDRFHIERKGNGFELQVSFDKESPTIWNRAARRHILGTLPVARRAALQQQLQEFFASDREEFDYHDATFPFRLGNGGTLPIVRLRNTEYFALFYREAHPTGWNIANGGANTRYDLLHPDAIVERELREELVIVEPERREWYVFDWDDARLRDHQDFVVAQQLWTSKFRERQLPDFKRIPLPLKWTLPPDAELTNTQVPGYDSMVVEFDNECVYTGQGFLNINAEDFGIEFDRIAKLTVGPGAVFCDGEVSDGRLVNRVVGLFPVEAMHEQLELGATHFEPVRWFWEGKDRTRHGLRETIANYLRERGTSWEAVEESIHTNLGASGTVQPFNLCPVTRTIIERHRRLLEAEAKVAEPPRNGDFDVFISFAVEDRVLANQVYQHLKNTTRRRVFFSDVELTCGAFSDQIDRALDTARAFVAVGSRAEHLHKSWVKFEWQNFHNDMMSNRKSPAAPFFVFFTGKNHQDLPRPFARQQNILADANQPAEKFPLVAEYVERAWL